MSEQNKISVEDLIARDIDIIASIPYSKKEEDRIGKPLTALSNDLVLLYNYIQEQKVKLKTEKEEEEI